MEFNSTLSNIKRASGARRTAISSVFMSIANEYAKTAQEQIDPNQLQVGQSVFNNTGAEFIVVDDPEGTTNKVLMPAEQQGQPVPAVETVEDTELQTSYSITSPSEGGTSMPEMPEMAQTAKRAQYEDDDVDWDEIESIVIDMKAFTRRKDMQGLTAAVEEMTNFILSHMEMPDDMSMPPMFARLLGKCIVKRAKNAKKAKEMKILPEFRTALSGMKEIRVFGLYKVDFPEGRAQKPDVVGDIDDLNEWAHSKGLEFVEDESLFGGYYRDPEGREAWEAEWQSTNWVKDSKRKAQYDDEYEDIKKAKKSCPSTAPSTRTRVANPPPMAKEGAVEVLPEFRKTSGQLKGFKANLKDRGGSSRYAQIPDTSTYPDVQSFHDPVKGPSDEVDLNSQTKKDDPELVIGDSGFVDIMNDIKKMTDSGCEVVDVILTVGEKYPREQGARVLEEARKEGVL